MKREYITSRIGKQNFEFFDSNNLIVPTYTRLSVSTPDPVSVLMYSLASRRYRWSVGPFSCKERRDVSDSLLALHHEIPCGVTTNDYLVVQHLPLLAKCGVRDNLQPHYLLKNRDAGYFRFIGEELLKAWLSL